MTIKDIADHLRISWDTIKQIQKVDSYPTSVWNRFSVYRDILDVVRIIQFLQGGAGMSILSSGFAIPAFLCFLFPVGIG
jgi:hypothetical protein